MIKDLKISDKVFFIHEGEGKKASCIRSGTVETLREYDCDLYLVSYPNCPSSVEPWITVRYVRKESLFRTLRGAKRALINYLKREIERIKGIK